MRVVFQVVCVDAATDGDGCSCCCILCGGDIVARQRLKQNKKVVQTANGGEIVSRRRCVGSTVARAVRFHTTAAAPKRFTSGAADINDASGARRSTLIITSSACLRVVAAVAHGDRRSTPPRAKLGLFQSNDCERFC